MPIQNNFISSSGVTPVFTATNEVAITTVFLCNTSDTQNCNVDVHLTPSGISAGSATMVFKQLYLPAAETFVFDTEKILLTSGDKIQALSDVGGIVTVTVSYVQVS